MRLLSTLMFILVFFVSMPEEAISKITCEGESKAICESARDEICSKTNENQELKPYFSKACKEDSGRHFIIKTDPNNLTQIARTSKWDGLKCYLLGCKNEVYTIYYDPLKPTNQGCRFTPTRVIAHELMHTWDESNFSYHIYPYKYPGCDLFKDYNFNGLVDKSEHDAVRAANLLGAVCQDCCVDNRYGSCPLTYLFPKEIDSIPPPSCECYEQDIIFVYSVSVRKGSSNFDGWWRTVFNKDLITEDFSESFPAEGFDGYADIFVKANANKFDIKFELSGRDMRSAAFWHQGWAVGVSVDIYGRSDLLGYGELQILHSSLGGAEFGLADIDYFGGNNYLTAELQWRANDLADKIEGMTLSDVGGTGWSEDLDPVNMEKFGEAQLPLTGGINMSKLLGISSLSSSQYRLREYKKISSYSAGGSIKAGALAVGDGKVKFEATLKVVPPDTLNSGACYIE